MDGLGERVAKIEERNRRVELEKAWETSLARKLVLMIFTYLAVGLYLEAIAIPNAWQNAIVPAVAFMLSTLTLPFLKKMWLARMHKK